MSYPYGPYYYRSPDELPTPLNIPTIMRQNETNSWLDPEYEDVNGNVYSAGNYTLTYWLAGPSTAPVSVVATAAEGSSGWSTSITPALAKLLLPGTYWWQGILTATNFQLVADQGELTVQVDVSAQTGVYDGRSVAEKALANCETALATFATSGGVVRRYQINGRMMEFATIAELIALRDMWKRVVNSAIDQAAGGRSRNLLLRFSRAH